MRGLDPRIQQSLPLASWYLGCQVKPATSVKASIRRIVLPGLINAPMHSNQSFEQGAYDNLPLELRLATLIPIGEQRRSEREHYLRT